VLVATHYVPAGLAPPAASLTRFDNGEVVEHLEGQEARERLSEIAAAS